MSDDILERENTFVNNINNNLIKSKNWSLSEGVRPWVIKKLFTFSLLLFPLKNDWKLCLTIF